MLRTFAFFCALLLSSLLPCAAQHTAADTLRSGGRSAGQVRGVQYSSPEEAARALALQKRLPLIAGVSVMADACGAFMAAFTPYGQYEAAVRLNMRGKYFPVFEMGLGVSDHTNETTELHYNVHSPYYRLGLDYNFCKNVRSGNRLFAGVRYGFTTFKYDLSGPDLTDAIYGGTLPYRFEGVRGTNHWAEVLFGLETKVWGILHLGWSIRYKFRLYNKESNLGNAWYIPGYGKNDSHALGGSFNLIFDI